LRCERRDADNEPTRPEPKFNKASTMSSTEPLTESVKPTVYAGISPNNVKAKSTS
jgi:hypothetical protein